MNPEWVYFLKVNAGIALFYAFYRLFFYRDTFFTWRRTALFGFFILSFLYPLLNLQDWIKNQEPIVAMVDLYASAAWPEYTPTVTASEVIDWEEVVINSLGYLYISGILLLCIRFLLQLSSIIRLRVQSRRSMINDIFIYELPHASSPFSFFHWIFVHPTSHTEEELDEILIHELTHARQYHSIDVILSELICIACWFNPFAWLMKREVRNNLEYLADHRVIQTGRDYQSYQFHLLGLAHQKAAANLSNSFNVLPLKNRIKMMNKKRTKEIGRTKYLLFLPLATLLMIFSNIETVARTTKSIAKEVILNVENKINEEAVEKMNSTTLTTETSEMTPPQDKKKVSKDTKTKEETKEEDEKVHGMAEKMPDFPGGMEALMTYINKTIKYPEKAMKENISGRVIVQFIVRKDGTVTNPRVVKGVDPELDAEAMRIVSIMPKWIPGEVNGKPASVKYTVPVMFKPFGGKGTAAKEVKESKLPEVTVVSYAADEKPTNEGTVFEVVEEMPQYPGGINALMEYLGKSIKYPVEAQKSNIQGRVIVSMIVDETGKVTHPHIVNSVSPSLDAEAIRVVSRMPQWVPGKQRGETVRVRYSLPIAFRLQKPEAVPTEAKK
ncbi:MAG: M56 family metallopeptidase [Bacteroides sp.]|uniref:M56 family metallopeptidase n=1 Tax=Bacteroides sp. TaxID=29523 RepID=UPI002FCBBE44